MPCVQLTISHDIFTSDTSDSDSKDQDECRPSSPHDHLNHELHSDDSDATHASDNVNSDVPTSGDEGSTIHTGDESDSGHLGDKRNRNPPSWIRSEDYQMD